MYYNIITHTDMCAEPNNVHTVTVRIEDGYVHMRFFSPEKCRILNDYCNPADLTPKRVADWVRRAEHADFAYCDSILEEE